MSGQDCQPLAFIADRTPVKAADCEARNLMAELRAMGLQIELQCGIVVVTPLDSLDIEARQLVAALSPDMARLIAADWADEPQPNHEQARPFRARLCGNCRHLLRRGTCAEPVAAGLIDARAGYGIAWPTHSPAAACPAFADRTGDRDD